MFRFNFKQFKLNTIISQKNMDYIILNADWRVKKKILVPLSLYI